MAADFVRVATNLTLWSQSRILLLPPLLSTPEETSGSASSSENIGVLFRFMWIQRFNNLSEKVRRCVCLCVCLCIYVDVHVVHT